MAAEGGLQTRILQCDLQSLPNNPCVANDYFTHLFLVIFASNFLTNSCEDKLPCIQFSMCVSKKIKTWSKFLDLEF